MEENVIKIENVSVTLGGRDILKDINLDLHAGEFVAILGPNGAGKSTLLQLILGLVKVQSGRVSVLGRAVKRGNPAIGYSPQVKPFDPDIPITGREYVGLGLMTPGLHPFMSRKGDAKKIDNILEQLGASALGAKRLGRMSGGQQQLISLAQALVSDPHLLLLDEPLANLDISYQSDILERISAYHKDHNHTVLLVAHDVNPLLPHISRVVYLANTHAKIGSPEEVIQESVLTELYGQQVHVFTVHKRMFVAISETGHEI